MYIPRFRRFGVKVSWKLQEGFLFTAIGPPTIVRRFNNLKQKKTAFGLLEMCPRFFLAHLKQINMSCCSLFTQKLL